jgi:hypothetical protein
MSVYFEAGASDPWDGGVAWEIGGEAGDTVKTF